MKMNEICEQQVANEEYIPIILDESIAKTLHPEEVKIIKFTNNLFRYLLLIIQNIAQQCQLNITNR